MDGRVTLTALVSTWTPVLWPCWSLVVHSDQGWLMELREVGRLHMWFYEPRDWLLKVFCRDGSGYQKSYECRSYHTCGAQLSTLLHVRPFHLALHFCRAQTLISGLKIFLMPSKPGTTLPGLYIYKSWMRVLLKHLNVSGNISARPQRFLIFWRPADNVLDLTKGIRVDSRLVLLTDAVSDWSYEDVSPQEIGRLHLTQNPWVCLPSTQWNHANQPTQ